MTPVDTPATLWALVFRANDRWNLILLAAALAVLLATARGYLPFVADDALISFRYSERLLDGKGLTFTDGERVEGYSNLLWVLIVAAGGLITRDLILVGRIAGVTATCLADGGVRSTCCARCGPVHGHDGRRDANGTLRP